MARVIFLCFLTSCLSYSNLYSMQAKIAIQEEDPVQVILNQYTKKNRKKRVTVELLKPVEHGGDVYHFATTLYWTYQYHKRKPLHLTPTEWDKLQTLDDFSREALKRNLRLRAPIGDCPIL
jgi:hypothetical protein